MSRVVPTAGIKYLAELKSFQKDGKDISYFKHYPYESIGAMAGAALELDEEGCAVYFALAGFSDPVETTNKKTGKPKTLYRTQPQAVAVKAFWADIDCGEAKAETGQGYATKQEAAQAVKRFCQATQLPVPLIVDSGSGLHCYWTLASEIPGDQWIRVAPYWRAVLNHFHLRSDPARDMDVASVLRPVGTTNRKAGVDRTVKAVVVGQENIPPGEFIKQLIRLIKSSEIPVAPRKTPVPAHLQGPSLNDDLAVTREYPPSSATLVIEKCAQMREFADMRGDVSEPIWRLALGLIKHTVEGEDLAHDLSSGHPDYDADETQEKLDRWEVGPPSCAAFSSHNCSHCDDCPYNGKITSPIQLGVQKSEESTTKTIETENESIALELPPGFSIMNMQLHRALEDSDGLVYHVPVVSNVFHVVERVFHVATGTFDMVCRVIKARGKIKTFTLPTSMVQSSKLAETLAGYEVFVMSKAIDHVREFLRLSNEMLAAQTDESRSVPCMGWSSEMSEFVFGTDVYRTDGTVGSVVPDSHSLTDAAAVDISRGNVEGWSEGVNLVYARPGMEVMQYAICSAFGSTLAPLVGSSTYKGVLLALSSVESGLGKTTVAHFALSAFGDPDALTVDGKDGATPNALFARMATLNNIPLLLDEFSDVDPKFLSVLAYSTINGRERRRLKQSGELREERTWAMSPFITSNTNLGRVLMAEGVNNEAQAVRIMEFSLDRCRIPKLTPHQMLEAEQLVRDNVGVAGRAFMAAVTQDLDGMKERVAKWFTRIIEHDPRFTESKFRFYRGHMATTLAAGELLVEMGLVSFNIEAVFKWVSGYLLGVMENITETFQSLTDDAISRMIDSFSPNLIVTRGFSDGKKGVETPLRPVHGEPMGRCIMGGDQVPRELHQVLMIPRQRVRAWCVAHRVDYDSMIANGRNEGMVIDSPFNGEERVSISKGTDVVAGRVRCDFFDLARISGGVRLIPVADKKGKAEDLAV